MYIYIYLATSCIINLTLASSDGRTFEDPSAGEETSGEEATWNLE